MLSRAELQALLSHPDPFVRSDADWTREYRGWGWRQPHLVRWSTADLFERQLIAHLTTYNERLNPCS